MTIELDQKAIEALAQLRRQAELRNVPFDAYLQQLADAGGNGASSSLLSIPEMEHLLNELAAGPMVPQLPSGFSRAEIYTEHD